jgi:hypothetical protein
MINPIADFFAMRRAIVARSRILDAWGFFLNVPVLVGGIVFIARPVGAATAAAIVVSLFIASQMHKRWPMSRLLGLCHVVFLPVLVLQAAEAASITLFGPFEIWLLYSLFMMSLCVLIDLFDLFRYAFLGNRTYVDGGQ